MVVGWFKAASSHCRWSPTEGLLKEVERKEQGETDSFDTSAGSKPISFSVSLD